MYVVISYGYAVYASWKSICIMAYSMHCTVCIATLLELVQSVALIDCISGAQILRYIVPFGEGSESKFPQITDLTQSCQCSQSRLRLCGSGPWLSLEI